jgi:hypothetical protein
MYIAIKNTVNANVLNSCFDPFLYTEGQLSSINHEATLMFHALQLVLIAQLVVNPITYKHDHDAPYII